jgi:hypothetical protein
MICHRRTLRIATLVLSFAASPLPLAARQADVPPLAMAGLEAFRAAGADSAIAVWLSGARFDSPATRSTLGQAFARMEEQAGRQVGFDIVRSLAIGTHVRRIYVVLHFEGAPAYLYLEFYLAPTGWIAQAIEFNGNPRDVFPPGLLEP